MLDYAQCNACAYISGNVSYVAPVRPSGSEEVKSKPRSRSGTCLYCGYSYHYRRDCLATDKTCYVVKRDIFMNLSG